MNKNTSISRMAELARLARVPALIAIAFAMGLLMGGGEASSPESHTHSEERAEQPWTCSMHPHIRSGEPGACPICGMDLIPAQSSSSAEAPGEIGLSEAAKVRARIRTSAVRRQGTGGLERRLLGRVDYDETRMRTVTSWIGGRIDRLHVRTTGQAVKRGQVIATLYSPEVFGAHQDLLVARDQVKRLANATDIARSGAEAALSASRDRLRLLGVTAAALTAMESAKRPSEQVKIRTPFAGTILERLATEGSYVKTGTGLFQVADLSRLWVQLDAYESDLSLLSVGQLVSLKVEALPGETFEGRVTFVDPVLNQRTRTTRVRIEVRNRDGQLRPGMFAEAVVRQTRDEESPSALVIPETAPLFTGRRSLVYVEKPDASRPTYQARVVKLGPKTGEVYPVIAGLREGERVVVHGAFTLDADLQIRGGLSMMTVPDDNGKGPYDDVVVLPEGKEAAFSKLVLEYLLLHEALASDDLVAAKTASAEMGDIASSIKAEGPTAFVEAWAPLSRQFATVAPRLSEAGSLPDARAAFRDVSQLAATLLRIFGNPTGETVRLAFCPMALEGEGAEWLQRAENIENPYFGSSMHSCGDIHQSVEHGTFLPLTGDVRDQPGASHTGGHSH